MFQQAYNKLKQVNDDRQSIIRHIRDNPKHTMYVPQHLLLDLYNSKNINMSTYDVNIHTFKVVTTYDIDMCYTQLYYNYGAAVSIALFTFKTTTVIDMWLEHHDKVLKIKSGDLNTSLTLDVIRTYDRVVSNGRDRTVYKEEHNGWINTISGMILGCMSYEDAVKYFRAFYDKELISFLESKPEDFNRETYDRLLNKYEFTYDYLYQIRYNVILCMDNVISRHQSYLRDQSKLLTQTTH